ncbi:MAG TPA: hypothetical protein VMV52_06300 [Candidatus Nanopelagicaceae bacterium]|nr:hypothetical protein [Candidatus Nanopelagicaceae bacterium]
MNIPRAKLALLIAGIYGLCVIVAGFLVPMYSTLSVSSTGKEIRGSATLVTENGINVVFVLAIPLIVTLATGLALKFHAKRRTMVVAWTLASLLALFNLAAIMTIGLFIAPVTICLFYACSRYTPDKEK